MGKGTAEAFGVVLVKGFRYNYKGVLFKYGQKAEVDRATRDHLIRSGHFRDVEFEAPEPEPIPVKRSRVRVKKSEPGMASSEGGATATGKDSVEV